MTKHNMPAAEGVAMFWQQEQLMLSSVNNAFETFLESIKRHIRKPEEITLSELQSAWFTAVSEQLVPAIEAEYLSAYDLVRGEAGNITASSELPVDITPELLDYLSNTFDRLALGLQPPLPLQAYQKVKYVITLGVDLHWSTQQVAQRLAEILDWSGPDYDYWRGQKAAAEKQLDAILDAYGEPGDPLREAVRVNGTNPTVSALQNDMSEAAKVLARKQSIWKTRANLIARTESAFAFNAGNLQALLDEGWTHKVWLSADTARPDHKLANGQKVHIGGKFLVGGESLLMPGDPTASAAQVCNCRCILLGEDD